MPWRGCFFPSGPVRFASANKSARGYRLAKTGAAEAPEGPRSAGAPAFDGEATVEMVARDVLRDCLAQIAANMAVVADSAALEGPHQLRVGLRRLRTAFAVFGPSLGAASMKPISEVAQGLGRVVGELRDADVLMAEVVAGAARFGLDPGARGALDAGLEARRDRVRAEVRAELAGAGGSCSISGRSSRGAAGSSPRTFRRARGWRRRSARWRRGSWRGGIGR